MNMDGAVRITCVLLPIVAGLLFIQTGRSNWGLILFGRFGVRCKRLLEQNTAQALVGIRLDGQQKQIAQKTAKITKGLGINRAPTGCGTQLGEAQ
jgi:hypothetical protein